LHTTLTAIRQTDNWCNSRNSFKQHVSSSKVLH